METDSSNFLFNFPVKVSFLANESFAKRGDSIDFWNFFQTCDSLKLFLSYVVAFRDNLLLKRRRDRKLRRKKKKICQRFKLIEEVQLVNRATFFSSNHVCICKVSKLEYIVYSKKCICRLIDGAIS